MIFKNGKVFRAALRENSIRDGYEFKFIKNDVDRVTVVCADDCPWRIHASEMQGSKTFQIKTMTKHILHPRRYKMNAVTSTWLADKYMDKLIDDPKIKVKAIIRSAKRDFGVFISLDQAYRAKWKALERIESNHQQQYMKVRDYCEMVMTQNVGSVAKVQVERPFPTAGAFFFKGCFQCSRHKEEAFYQGLVETFNELMPGVEHRFCVRHLYANFKLLFKGNDLKDIVWGAASAYTLEEFKDYTQALKGMNKAAYNWLIKVPLNTWARSHFSYRSKCDIVSYNLCESFHQFIKEARDKPIITMVETIRWQLMARFREEKELISTFKDEICPRIMKQVKEAKFTATKCEAILAGKGIFEVQMGVRIGVQAFVVDIGKRSYENKWVHNESNPILPPKRRTKLGRPKKLRKKALDEKENATTISRQYEQAKCGNCGAYGHNKRRCKEPPTQINFPCQDTNNDNGKEKATTDNSKGKGKITNDNTAGKGKGNGATDSNPLSNVSGAINIPIGYVVPFSSVGSGAIRGSGSRSNRAVTSGKGRCRGRIGGDANPLGPDGLGFNGDSPVFYPIAINPSLLSQATNMFNQPTLPQVLAICFGISPSWWNLPFSFYNF
ncbi:hypothetical protein ACH5RR_000966 [Cinchona calisaya]|uniref:CCHC-type domain-containing protein n=1 Tax=Cinchona calisaya TaxID=153742 RepID=A0ABD3B234_9GENT